MQYEEYERVEEDKKWSALNFEKLIAHPVMDLLDLKQIYSIENYCANEKIKQILDQKIGTDYIGIKNNGFSTIGIANRVQWAHPLKGSNSWASPEEEWWPNRLNSFIKNKGKKTHTVRLERDSGAVTEFRKRLIAIENEYEFPVYTIQSYVSDRENGTLLSLAIAKTKDLILFIKKGKSGYHYDINKVDKNGRALFYYVKWELFINYHELIVWPPDFIRKSSQGNLSKFFD